MTQVVIVADASQVAEIDVSFEGHGSSTWTYHPACKNQEGKGGPFISWEHLGGMVEVPIIFLDLSAH